MTPPAQRTTQGRIVRALDRLVPPGLLADREAALRGRMLVAATLSIAALAFVSLVVRVATAPFDAGAVVGFATIAAIATLPAVQWLTGSHRIAGGGFIAVCVVTLPMFHWLLGVFPAPALLFFSVVPLFAAFLVGVRAGAVTAVVMGGLVVGLKLGLPVPTGERVAGLSWTFAAIAAVVCLTNSLVAAAYEYARERQEQALLAANNRLQATMAAIPDVLFEIDGEERFVGHHSISPDLLVMPPERFLGRRLDEVLPPELAAIARAAMREAAERGRSSGRQYAVTLADGPRWFELSVARKPAEDPQTPLGFVLLTRDITRHHETEAALEAARERAEQASLAKSRFLANMSHEIRTPMNGLLGMAEVLDRSLSEPEHRRMLAVIRESGELLLGVINDILDMSKIEAGKLEVEQIAFTPQDLVRRIASVHALKAAERGIALSIEATSGADVPRLGDPHRILQILHNLLGNAIKFTERGSVAVTLSCDPRGPLTIDVRDTGIGMSEEQLSRVFLEFAQADATTTRRFGGTGLGMPIVRALVTLMRGAIDVESSPGEGTRVRVELPLPVAPAAAPESPPAEPPADELAGLRVLAVDDNEINRLVLAAMLKELAVTTTMESSGAAAVERVAETSFDLLLLDISMPDMDGITALRAIRAIEARQGRPPSPAVAVTANAFEQQIAEYLAAGFDAHLAKPLRPQALQATLAAARRRVAAAAPPRA